MHEIILEVVKKLILKGLIMKELSSIEKNLNILFPQSYKNTLDKFKLFQVYLYGQESFITNWVIWKMPINILT